MSLLAFLLFLVLGGFLLGALARLAVPGPDPMPFWLTVAIGIAGSLVGGFVAQIVLGSSGSLLFAYIASVLLVILYRRVVQGRGITGPASKEPPTRGWG